MALDELPSTENGEASLTWIEHRDSRVKMYGQDAIVCLLPRELAVNSHLLTRVSNALARGGICTIQELADADLYELRVNGRDWDGPRLLFGQKMLKFASLLQGVARAELLRRTEVSQVGTVAEKEKETYQQLGAFLDSLPPSKASKGINSRYSQDRDEHLKKYGEKSIYSLLPQSLPGQAGFIVRTLKALCRNHINTISDLTQQDLNVLFARGHRNLGVKSIKFTSLLQDVAKMELKRRASPTDGDYSI